MLVFLDGFLNIFYDPAIFNDNNDSIGFALRTAVSALGKIFSGSFIAKCTVIDVRTHCSSSSFVLINKISSFQKKELERT